MTEAPKLLVRDVMRTTPLVTIPEDATLAELERVLIEHHVSGLPVTRGQKVVGVVSRTDVLRQISLGRTLAEISTDYYHDLVGIVGTGHGMREDAELAGQIVIDRLENTRVRDVMAERVIAVAPGDSIVDAASEMVERGIHRVLVLEEGRLVGIVSSLDFAALFVDGRAG